MNQAPAAITIEIQAARLAFGSGERYTHIHGILENLNKRLSEVSDRVAGEAISSAAGAPAYIISFGGGYFLAQAKSATPILTVQPENAQHFVDRDLAVAHGSSVLTNDGSIGQVVTLLDALTEEREMLKTRIFGIQRREF